MYEIYRTVKTKDEYFATWDNKNYEMLNTQLKDEIYSRYVIKCFVFQRDGFKCKNELCKHTSAPLTLHHIRFQKNNGKDSVRNCVTLCYTCHNGFHRGKNSLTFDGATYKISKVNSVSWKEQKKKNKVLRKNLRMELETNSIMISPMLFEQLMKFLMIGFSDCEDNEEDD